MLLAAAHNCVFIEKGQCVTNWRDTYKSSRFGELFTAWWIKEKPDSRVVPTHLDIIY